MFGNNLNAASGRGTHAPSRGTLLSRTALRDQLRAAGMRWQRTRYVVAAPADPEQKAAFRDDLEAVKKER